MLGFESPVSQKRPMFCRNQGHILSYGVSSRKQGSSEINRGVTDIIARNLKEDLLYHDLEDRSYCAAFLEEMFY